MKARAIASVIALTLASMTSPASADEPPPPPAASAEHAERSEHAEEAKPGATPLATRPSKPLTLASTGEGTPFGYKLLAGLGVAAAAALWIRKKRGARPALPMSKIDVLARTSLGVRSELLVVEVEGTRLLVGMTPSAIQTLAVLDGDAVAETATEGGLMAGEPVDTLRRRVADSEPLAEEPAAEPVRLPMLDVADRARALLEGGRAGGKPAPSRPRRAASSSSTSPSNTTSSKVKPAKVARVAGQAKGLLLALEPAADDASEGGRPARHRDRPVRLGDG